MGTISKVILEIRAGAGGDEASIFAGDLTRMYQKYAQKRGWSFSIPDYNETSLGGYKSLVAEVSGGGVYDAFQNESGVHRVQRVPKTEKSGRVHTSTASVAVLPVVEAKEVNINQNDIEITLSRAERSQHANREKALEILRAKLFEMEKLRAAGSLTDIRREQIGSGERSEKIRTYNVPQDRVTDHRINKKWGRIENIFDGNLDPIVEAFKKFPAAQK